jgi:hypothetical protein
MKRQIASALTLAALTVFASAARAQDDEEEKSSEGDSGGSLDSGDPADSETSDDGPYEPKSEEKKDDKDQKPKKPVKKEEEAPPPPRPEIQAFGQLLFGFGAAPIPAAGETPRTPDATTISLLLGGVYDIKPDLSVGLTLPVTYASVKDPGATNGAFAFGAPELSGEIRLPMSTRVELPIRLALGVPVAQGEADPTSTDPDKVEQARVNQLADAAHGWQRGELFAVQRLPITPSIGIVYRRRDLNLFGYTKFILGVNVGGSLRFPEQPTTGSYNQNGLSLRNVTGGGINYDFALFDAGLDTWIAADALPPVEFESDLDANTESRVQWVLVPSIGRRFGSVHPRLGYIAPVGGLLGDMQSVFIRADLAF